MKQLDDNPDNIQWEIKRRQSEDSANWKKHPSTTNELPFDNSIRNPDEKVKKYSIGADKRKAQQLAIIQETNPMWDDYHTGIRSVEDTRTWEEVLELNDESEGQFVWGDFSREDAENALKNNSVTVYSSHPISDGTFVSTSYIQAWEYAGGNKSAKVYSKEVPLDEVAWINGDEGQYAKVEEGQSVDYSLSTPNEDLVPVGNFNIHGWDIADIDAPIRDDINGDLIAETNDQKGTNSDTTFNADAEPIREDISQSTQTAEETSSMENVSEKIRIKIQNLQTELDNNQRLREESSADYEAEIARLQSEYEAKKNKTTRAANDLLRRIERMERLKNNVDADYASRISDLKDRIENR